MEIYLANKGIIPQVKTTETTAPVILNISEEDFRKVIQEVAAERRAEREIYRGYTPAA